MNVLVTGANGFIGKNLCAWLARRPGVNVLSVGRENSEADLQHALARADIVFHLAGVNRPQTEEAFRTDNVELTARICNMLLAAGRATPLVLASSIQATLDNSYGVSKRQAEGIVEKYAAQSGGRGVIFRLPNVFGKWCRPNYNSVVATFCHNIAHDQPIVISDPAHELDLIYIDDLIRCFLDELAPAQATGLHHRQATPSYRVQLGQLAELIHAFRAARQTLLVPNFADTFVRKLYATYLSYLAPDDFAYALDPKCDARGCLAEFVKSGPFGQIFVSRTLPGVTRGNHFHHTKTEKFMVVEGDAIIRFRHILDDVEIEYRVRGDEFRVLDIPPGYTHAIENVGAGELITLFWASEIFEPERPDTFAEAVHEVLP